jgi:hypothetical protein
LAVFVLTLATPENDTVFGAALESVVAMELLAPSACSSSDTLAAYGSAPNAAAEAEAAAPVSVTVPFTPAVATIVPGDAVALAPVIVAVPCPAAASMPAADVASVVLSAVLA